MNKFLLLIFFTAISVYVWAQEPKDFTIPVKVIAGTNAEQGIYFNWPVNINATNYTIRKKLLTNQSFADVFVTIDSLNDRADTISGYTDYNIQEGIFYEYEIAGTFTNILPANRNTYLCAGIKVGAIHSRGTIILVCDNTISSQLQEELITLNNDLVGDGWKVKRFNVTRSDNAYDVVTVKNQIVNIYQQNPDTKQVFIIGHVPVPYSGLIYPDGHNNHYGAWPTDAYYGDMVNSWTDITVNNSSATRPENQNKPSDGKFDQSNFASVQLGVGRIDFYNLPAFAPLQEKDLFRRYFEKAHRFKMGIVKMNKKALVQDGFSTYAEKFSQGAWKSGAANIGYDNVVSGIYNTVLTTASADGGYLWSYGCGAGSYDIASGICATTDFATKSYNTVFTSIFGSYFGDWDSPDNLMRASIASAGSILTCVWSGRPHWFFHQMSAGFPIGYSALTTINNKGIYNNTGHNPAMAHTSLLGDPTLRSNYIKPPSGIASTIVNAWINLRWNASLEENITGYNIYRSNSITGSFTLLNNEPVISTSFNDTMPLTGKNVYQVKTVKTENIVSAGLYTNTSTYLNSSIAIIDSAFFSNVVLPVNLLSFAGRINECNTIINWKATEEYNVKEYIVEYSISNTAFQPVGKIPVTASQNNNGFKVYSFAHNPAPGNAFYRLKMVDNDNQFSYSQQLHLFSGCNKNEIHIYPVPVSNLLHIDVSYSIYSNQNEASLLDATGSILQKVSLKNGNNIINCATIPKGVYTLSVNMNGEIKNYKIVK